MPSIINGAIKFNSVSGGTINFGDTGMIAPKSASKTTQGAGGTVGDFSNVITGTSITNSTSSAGVSTSTKSAV